MSREDAQAWGMPTIYYAVPVVFAVGGLVLYALADKPKPMRIGEIMWFAGLLAALLLLAHVKF